MDNYEKKWGDQLLVSPSDDLNPNEKDGKWILAKAKYIFGSAMRSESTPFKRKAFYEHLRELAEGRQSTKIYQKQFDVNLTSTASNTATDVDTIQNGQNEIRLGLGNIDWKPVKLWNKFEMNLLGRFQAMEHDIQLDAVDELSAEEKSKKKWDLWMKAKYAPEIAAFKASQDVSAQMGGQPAPQQETEYIPESFQELEFLEQIGNFKLTREMIGELLLRHSFDVSNWETDLKDKLILDLIRLSIAATKDYYDPTDCKLKAHYIDPANLFIQHSNRYDFKNSEYAGHIVLFTCAELREYGFSEETLEKIAAKYAGDYGNFGQKTWSSYKSQFDGDYGYNDYVVPVLDGEFVSFNTSYLTKKVNSKGLPALYDETYDKGRRMYAKSIDEGENEKKKVIKNQRKVIYKFKWVLDTDEIFDFGLQNNTASDSKEVNLSFHVYKLPGPSVVETVESFIHTYHNTWYKFQNEFAKASPAGIAVEWDSIANLQFGGQKLIPYQVLKLRQTEGDFVYSASKAGIDAMVKGTNQGKPIQALPSEILGVVQAYIPAFDFCLGQIAAHSGISDSASGTNPDPNASVRGSEMALAGTIHRIKPLYSGYIRVKEMTANNILLRLLSYLKYDQDCKDAYYPVIGKSKVESYALISELSNSQYGIKTVARPTEKEKQEIEIAMQTAMQSGKNGNPSLTIEGYMLVKRILMNSGSIKYAQAILAYITKKETEKANAQAEKMVQMQNQGLMQKDQQLAQLNKQADDSKTANQIKLITVKADLDLRNMVEEYKLKFNHESKIGTQQAVHQQNLKGMEMESETETEQPEQETGGQQPDEQAMIEKMMGSQQGVPPFGQEMGNQETNNNNETNNE
jgi:hypothetical protein